MQENDPKFTSKSIRELIKNNFNILGVSIFNSALGCISPVSVGGDECSPGLIACAQRAGDSHE